MKEFQDFFAIALANLCESKPCEAPWVKKLAEQATIKPSEQADWLICDDNILKEKDRSEHSNVSFNFVLGWIRCWQQTISNFWRQMDSYDVTKISYLVISFSQPKHPTKNLC